VHLEASTKSHVHQKFEIFWTNIASTMVCLNFKNGPKNGLGPLGVNFLKKWEGSWKTCPDGITKIAWCRTLCQVGKVCIPSTSSRILGLYNLWRRPFYRPIEDSDHYEMEKAKVNSRCLLFPWFYKLLSILYPRLFKDSCSVDAPYLQGQAWIEFESKPSFSRPQDCFHNGTNLNLSRFL
jgi:hypothetical protein